MRIIPVALFAAGYVAGTRAGHERYAQILEGAATASQRLEEWSARRPPRGGRSPGAEPPHRAP